jgi:hypothetical protein
MATYYWAGVTQVGGVGPTANEWGHTFGHFLTNTVSGALATTWPFGGDTVIFGATARSACLIGISSGFKYWPGYTGEGAAKNWAEGITITIEPRYGERFLSAPNLGYSFGSITGPINLIVDRLYIGLTANNAEISINNLPSGSIQFAHMDGQTATFYTSGQWDEVLVERGSLITTGLTAEIILVDGIQPARTDRTYFGTSTNVGLGVDKVEINTPSNIDSVIFTAQATKSQAVINGQIKSGFINAMGKTAGGYTFTTVQQNVRPAGAERKYNRITRTLKYDRS